MKGKSKCVELMMILEEKLPETMLIIIRPTEI